MVIRTMTYLESDWEIILSNTYNFNKKTYDLTASHFYTNILTFELEYTP